MQRVSFVSDLHKFASRSDADAFEPAIRRAAEECDRCVLGGDIFDFRWSTLPSREATADAAIEWLADLLTDCPTTEFHLLLGNHDHAEPLLDRLPVLFDQFERFHWHEYYLRIGSSVFLHGDAADVPLRAFKRGAGCQATRLAARRAKSRHHGARPRGRASNGIYKTFVRTRLHRAVPRVAYPKRRVARRLAHYLDGLGMAAKDGVRDVYFGHTHFPIRDYHYAGMLFHNGGAPIGEKKFSILIADVESDAEIHAH